MTELATYGDVKTDKEWAFELYETFARGGDDESLFFTILPGDPWSKARPRFARGRTYQPADDVLAEQKLRVRLKAASAEPFPGNVMLVCRFYRSNFQRVDTDNLLKHVCDSANGTLWNDDSQVTFVLGELQYDPTAPRTVILAGNHVSTLRRGDDRSEPCAHCGVMFIPSPGRRHQRFCSTPCAHAARTTSLSPITCSQCGSTFQPTTKAQFLCGKTCRAEHMRNRNKSKGGPKSRCTECGKELSHRRGGRCRDCWRANPGFYGNGSGESR